MRIILSMEKSDVLKIFKDTKALMDGHFILRSGMRSRQFFQCALALQEMPIVEKLVSALIDKWKTENVETIVAPAMGGLVLGQEVARQLKKRFIFVEKVDGDLALRRGFKLNKGEKVLVVEDVVTQGGRVRETLEIIKKLGAEPVHVLVLVDRSGGKVEVGSPLTSLLQMEVETFDPGNLPADLENIPAIKPGS